MNPRTIDPLTIRSPSGCRRPCESIRGGGTDSGREMKVIQLPRQQGKTTAIIRSCAELGGYIVVPTSRDVRRVFDAARDMGLSVPFPITFSEFIGGKFSTKIECFWIDDIDRCLATVGRGVPIAAVSIDALAEGQPTSTCTKSEH